jgi:hypothetical protein
VKDDLAARLLAQVLGWDAAAFAASGRQLQMLARHKYDAYEGYRPGEKFIESLASWLWQFEATERETALRFVLEELVVISRDELDHLIETIYPDMIRPKLIRRVAEETGQKPHKVAAIAASLEFADLQRKTLILGLADGARLDRLRRASPELSHEQFYLNPEMGPDSRKSMQEHMSRAVEALGLHPPPVFRHVILVDDFAGSGYTLLSRDQDEQWRGKLWKAAESLGDLESEGVVAKDRSVWVLLYVASSQAAEAVRNRLAEAQLNWTVLVAQTLTNETRVRDPDVLALCEKYFDPAILDIHLAKGDTPPHLGFGGAALPLAFHHNSPNNSISLIWADTTDRPASQRRRALFPRRHRHNPDRP